jgi:hypothetical protein
MLNAVCGVYGTGVNAGIRLTSKVIKMDADEMRELLNSLNLAVPSY